LNSDYSDRLLARRFNIRRAGAEIGPPPFLVDLILKIGGLLD
jgi:hypothetical protein